jgi:hypothetical protein
VEVSSSAAVLSLIIKLHIQIAENYRQMNRVLKCIKIYEDAYKVCRHPLYICFVVRLIV